MANEKMVRYFHALGQRAATFFSHSSAEQRLQIAIGVSIALHALVLMLHFSFPDGRLIRKESSLEVVLVNAKSARRPNDAQVRAQVNLDGGGNTDENRVLSSPLPPQAQQRTGDALMETRKRVQEAESRQQVLLARSKALPTPSVAQPTPKQPEPVPQAGLDLANTALAMARLEAKISKQVDDYNKRPRRNVVGTRAQSAVEAQYVEDWRQKVERHGNTHYPEELRGRFYGSLVLTVEIKADGNLVGVDVSRGSGNKVLDEAAIKIVRKAATNGFGAFPPALRKDTDILVITRTWIFESSDKLRTD